jgi:hypothetical protein
LEVLRVSQHKDEEDYGGHVPQNKMGPGYVRSGMQDDGTIVMDYVPAISRYGAPPPGMIPPSAFRELGPDPAADEIYHRQRVEEIREKLDQLLKKQTEPLLTLPKEDVVRSFGTGAVRSIDTLRDDPEAYLSPLVIDRFNEYMTKNRTLADGSIREPDNWQLGMPLVTYMKGLWRHMLHLWTRHRGYPVRDPKAAANIEEDLCAIMFNTQGYLHEVVKARLESEKVA